MLVVRVIENVRAVQSSYYSSCPCAGLHKKANFSTLNAGPPGTGNQTWVTLVASSGTIRSVIHYALKLIILTTIHFSYAETSHFDLSKFHPSCN
jgi:hypothetical protein